MNEPSMRTQSQVLTAEDEIFERVWLNRHCDDSVLTHDAEEYKRLCEAGISVTLAPPGSGSPESIRKAADAAYRCLEKYGEEAIVNSGYDLGFLEGKLSALRWVLGMDWDELDT